MDVDICNEQLDAYHADRSWFSYLWTTLGYAMFLTMVGGLTVVYASCSPALADAAMRGLTPAGGY